MLDSISLMVSVKNVPMEVSTTKSLKNVMTSALQPTRFTLPMDVSAEMVITELMEFVEDVLIEESIILSLSPVIVFLEKSLLEANVCQSALEMRPGLLMELVIVLLDTSECTTKFA